MYIIYISKRDVRCFVTGNEKDENIDFLDHHLRIPGNDGGNPTATDHLPPRQQLSFALPHGFHHHAGEHNDHYTYDILDINIKNIKINNIIIRV